MYSCLIIVCLHMLNTIGNMQNEMYFYDHCNEFVYNYTYMCESKNFLFFRNVDEYL